MTLPEAADLSSPIFLDGGTTNTRAWIAPEGRPLARSDASVGLRDVAVGARGRFETALRDLLVDIRRKGAAAGIPPPSCVVAAGMIASNQGLGDVPHVDAPAGLREIAATSRWIRVPWLTDLPVLLIAGVRTGGSRITPAATASADVMRGEETLCLGLLETGAMAPGGTLLNLGSHWKVIWTDSEGRILSSRTTITGELIHATQTTTILASSVPGGRPREIDFGWLEEGSAEARRSGLPRALFCVRLLDQRCETTAEQRLSYLIGAFLSADLDPILMDATLIHVAGIAIAGDPILAGAAARWLGQRGLNASVLSAEQIERGVVAGIYRVSRGAPPLVGSAESA